MRNIRYLFIAAFLGVPMVLAAQIPRNDPGLTLGARAGVTVKKNLASGTQLSGGIDGRLYGAFASERRVDLDFAAAYRIAPWLKAEAGYTLIGQRQYNEEVSFRQRLNAGLAAKYSHGRWKFNMKESLLLTNSPGEMNVWQHPRNVVSWRSRGEVKYKMNKRWSVPVYLELKYNLNDPSLNEITYDSSKMKWVTPDGSETGEKGWFLAGYDDFVLRRVRLGVGAEYKMKQGRTLKFGLVADNCHSLEIDADKHGRRLKSVVYDNGYRLAFRCSYVIEL